ncbi:hypothetical protein [Formosa algae]|uniref:Uncharacterized protein n=1 Tax=Formosa algae TaxID=225843 RepID=A0A9X1CCX9_9FLAO|nr:hypothetical protein [Formosa algae]MBP1840755.1 hypothetical protein [Formosa algae]MDQ0336348.1 hypothetical protein [Formosa algae]OEI78758.1 hypothetical protein AST99_17965 [Formosa algae]
MKENITDFINLDEKLKELKFTPESDFYILPENIETAKSSEDLVFTETTTEIKKYLNQNGVEIQVLQKGGLKLRQRKSVDFYAPLIFVGFTMLSENSTLLTIGINVLSNYVTDYFKGTFGSKNVKLEIIVETKPKKEYKSINYEGNVDGLKDLPKIIKALKNE